MRRRSFLAGSAALLVTSAKAAIPPAEMVQITPDLIAAAQKEGRVLVRYSSPVDEMTRTFLKRRMYSLIGEFLVGGIRGPPLKNAMGMSSLLFASR